MSSSDTPPATTDRAPAPLKTAGLLKRATHLGPATQAASRAEVLFEVPFESPMSDADVSRLVAVLNMVVCLHPKLHESPASAGVVRLDFGSGLFLLHGNAPSEWSIQARTWEHPAEQTVHKWHLLAADAARLLDANVPVPIRTGASCRVPVPIRPRGLMGRCRSSWAERFADEDAAAGLTSSPADRASRDRSVSGRSSQRVAETTKRAGAVPAQDLAGIERWVNEGGHIATDTVVD
jgi:hypothetical protein